MAGTRIALVVVGVVASACGAPQRTSASETRVAPGDLTPAAPETGATDHGETGRLARVILGGRRRRVTELYFRYLHAVAARDLASIGPLFDNVVFDVSEGTEAITREQLVAIFERIFPAIDTSAMNDVIARVRPGVFSVADLRRNGRTPPAGMHSDDWLVDTPLPFSPLLPRQIVVRWHGDTPVIAGASTLRSPYH